MVFSITVTGTKYTTTGPTSIQTAITEKLGYTWTVTRHSDESILLELTGALPVLKEFYKTQIENLGVTADFQGYKKPLLAVPKNPRTKHKGRKKP